MTAKSSHCLTCTLPIEYDSGLYGTPGWVEPSNLDIDHDGRTCETSGDPHIPAEADR